MERSGGDRPDPTRYARDEADNKGRRANKVVVAVLLFVLAIGAVAWAVVTLVTGDSDTQDTVENPISSPIAETPSTPIPTATAAPSPTPISTATAAPSPTPIPTATAAPGPVPIEGVRVNMARGTWLTSYFSAAIYRALLLELGYDVSDPAQATLDPADFYQAMAEGQYDFWANGWFPHHDQDMDQAGLAGIAEPVGWQMRSSGLRGFLVDKATAEAHGITKLDDIGDNPEVAALFDLNGNGQADLMGCNQNWPCRSTIEDTIAHNGWQATIEQVSANHTTLFANSLRRFQRGEPILVYAWSPSAPTAQLVPGEDVIWLSMDSPVPSRDAVADLPVDECPGQPCKLGFIPADIQVVARSDFLSANPAAAKLFDLVTISPSDVSQWALQYTGGNNTEVDIRAAANRWIAGNRATADRWLAAALMASGFPPPPTRSEPTPTPEPVATPAPEPVNETPGDGVQVRMARANWTTGYMQAVIYQLLLRELGYNVSDPANAELAPATFYQRMGRGEFDFWANGWYPTHARITEELGVDHLMRPIGYEILGGGLQGVLVDKATADAHGITRWDDIGNNPEIARLFDVDGNGKADIMGCNNGWNCQVVIDDTIAQNGWKDTIEQVTSGHFALFRESIRRLNRGEPILQYLWTPGAFTAELVPGTDVIWLSVNNPVAGQTGATALPVSQCPGQPCQTGFVPHDIRVVARNDFLAANPAAAKLFELVTIPLRDVSAQNLAYDGGANSEFDVRDAALRWITANRGQVDAWLNAARVASESAVAQPEPENDPIVAGFIYVTPVGDAGWSWAHDQGRRYAERQTGATTLFVEGVAEIEADFRPVAVDLIENEGADIIFGTAFGYMDVMEELALEYPDVVFEHATGFKQNDINFGNYFGRIYQPRFLSGVAAAMMTESDRIGYVAPFAIPEVIRGINAFTLGVRRYNPDAEVHVKWTFTWLDPAIEAQATADLLQDGADVITMHQESTASGLVAEEGGARWISYHSDMSSFAPNAFITAPVWNWGLYYESVINSVADGTYTPSAYWGGMEDNIVGLAPLAEDVPGVVAAIIAVLAAQLRNGEWDMFTGPIRDQDENVVVPQGETLDDAALLSMTYFVEGVVGNPQP